MSFIPALCFILCCSPFPDDKIEFNDYKSFFRFECRVLITSLCFINLFLFFYNLYN